MLDKESQVLEGMSCFFTFKMLNISRMTYFSLGQGLQECNTKTYAGKSVTSKFLHSQGYHKLISEYPFDPSSLYSSSCLEKLKIGENQYLLAADNSGNVKVIKNYGFSIFKEF